MAMINEFPAGEVLALARFIEACQRLRGTSRWRAPFCDCARRGSFRPYAAEEDAAQLRRLIKARGALVVCQMSTDEVRRCAAQVAEVLEG